MKHNKELTETKQSLRSIIKNKLSNQSGFDIIVTLFYQFLNNFLNIIKCIDRWLFGYIAALKYNSLNHLDVQGSIRLGGVDFLVSSPKFPADHLLFCIDLVLEPLSNTDWCKQNSYKNNPEIETKFRPNFTIFAMNSELQRIAHPMHLRLCFFLYK